MKHWLALIVECRRPSRRLLALLLFGAAALLSACDGDSDKPAATPTLRPVPTPVEFATESAFPLGDPSFDALPGANAEYGQLGASIYRIEMPDNWNGRLVLYLHGAPFPTPEELTVEAPPAREYLIRKGYAWGASSFSSLVYIPGTGADETAALWDFFTQQHGRPQYTYVEGISMGGAGAYIAAERYPDRLDGALPLCASAGTIPHIGAWFGDFFVAGAFAAGVTQAEFDPARTRELIETRIRPALDDAAARQRFEDIVIALTGGPRPFALEGLRSNEGQLWDESESAVGTGLFDNRETVYELRDVSGVSSDDFDRAAVRVTGGVLRNRLSEGQEITGDIAIPTLALHPTGDMQNPIHEEQLVRRRIEAAGKGDLLVQRTIRDPSHCGLTGAELEAGLEALADWAENGNKPDGEDLLAGDLSGLGEKYTLTPRLGSPEADDVPGADERVTLSGSLTIDGAPFEPRFIVALVRTGALVRDCGFQPKFTDDRYEIVVAGHGEADGCGAPGADIALVAFEEDQRFVAQARAPWPATPGPLTLDAAFTRSSAQSTDRPSRTLFVGTALDASGGHLAAGTRVEAYAGGTLCGVSSLPPAVMAGSDPSSYRLYMALPDELPGCARDAELLFRLDGKDARQTARHDGEFHVLDLSVQ